MEKVIPRNDPSSESMTQDNVWKKNTMLPQVENYDGNESGPSTTAGLGAPTGQVGTAVDYAVKDVNQTNGTRQPYLNISASEENRAAKFKYPTKSEDVPDAGRNQYQ